MELIVTLLLELYRVLVSDGLQWLLPIIIVVSLSVSLLALWLLVRVSSQQNALFSLVWDDFLASHRCPYVVDLAWDHLGHTTHRVVRIAELVRIFHHHFLLVLINAICLCRGVALQLILVNMLELRLFHWLGAVGLRQVDIIGPISDLAIVRLVQDHAWGSEVNAFVHMHHWVLKLLIVLFLFLLNHHYLSIFLGARLEGRCASSDMTCLTHIVLHWAFLCTYWLILIDIVANRALATSNWNGTNWHVEIGFVHFFFFLGPFLLFSKF